VSAAPEDGRPGAENTHFKFSCTRARMRLGCELKMENFPMATTAARASGAGTVELASVRAWRAAWLAAAALPLLALGPAQGAEPSQTSAARGEQLARLICSACHVVAADQEFPPLLRDPAPRFVDIANRPDTTEKSLRHFITTTHWDEKTLPMTMPNPELTEQQTIAVARYIVSLRKH